MRLRLVGTSFKTAPLEVRERLHVVDGELLRFLETLVGRPEVQECFVLSTCNRVELLANLREATGSAANGCVLTDFLVSYHRQDHDRLRPCLYTFNGLEAVAHTFRVASSLDSMVVGEPQIVAQVRAALAAARGAGTIGPVLGPVLDRALAVAKKVRTHTPIARHAVSISYAAVELARTIFGDLEGRRALLLGAGEMSELAARHLTKHGIAEVAIANRSADAALRLAADFEGEVVPEVVPWERHLESLQRADIVITSTSSPEPLIRADAVREIMPKRRHRMLFFVDIAVPRDVDPSVNEIDNVYLYDVDDLQAVVDENRAARQQAAAEAEQIVAREADRFVRALLAREVDPTIAKLRRNAELLRKRELDQLKLHLGELTEEQHRTLERFSQKLAKRLLHGPITELRRAVVQTRERDNARSAGLDVVSDDDDPGG